MTNGSGGGLVQEWAARMTAKGQPYRPKYDDSRVFMELRQGEMDDRILYAMNGYFTQSAYPTIAGFVDHFKEERESLPDWLVCRAYLSGRKRIIAMGADLDMLQAAWFPGPETQEKIEQLEKRLKAALT